MTTPAENASLGGLLSRAFEQLSSLVRSEIKLVQAELTEKVSVAGIAIGMIAGAAMFVIPALVLALMAFAALLVHFGMNAALADFLAAVLGLAIAATLAMMGLTKLRAQSLVPERAIGQMQRDATAIKEHVS